MNRSLLTYTICNASFPTGAEWRHSVSVTQVSSYRTPMRADRRLKLNWMTTYEDSGKEAQDIVKTIQLTMPKHPRLRFTVCPYFTNFDLFSSHSFFSGTILVSTIPDTILQAPKSLLKAERKIENTDKRNPRSGVTARARCNKTYGDDHHALVKQAWRSAFRHTVEYVGVSFYFLQENILYSARILKLHWSSIAGSRDHIHPSSRPPSPRFDTTRRQWGRAKANQADDDGTKPATTKRNRLLLWSHYTDEAANRHSNSSSAVPALQTAMTEQRWCCCIHHRSNYRSNDTYPTNALSYHVGNIRSEVPAVFTV